MSNDKSFSTGMYSVEGRLFSTRTRALNYCSRNRISAYKIALVPPPKVELDLADPVSLSIRPEWRLSTFFDGPDPILIVEHESKAHAFAVRMSELLDLVASVKARVRELAKEGEL